MPKVSKVFRYPIRGASSEITEQIDLDTTNGVIGDDEYLFVNSQRTKTIDTTLAPALALIYPYTEPGNGVKELWIRDLENLSSGITFAIETNMLGDPFIAWDGDISPVGFRIIDRNGGHNRWVSYDLQRKVLLAIRNPEESGFIRPMSPVRIVSTATIQRIEDQLGVPISAERLRPHIVIDGVEADEELLWIDREIRIGKCVVRILGKRMQIAEELQINPEIGRRDINRKRIERLNAQRSKYYRSWERSESVPVGVEALVVEAGSLLVGDEVEINGGIID